MRDGITRKKDSRDSTYALLRKPSGKASHTTIANKQNPTARQIATGHDNARINHNNGKNTRFMSPLL